MAFLGDQVPPHSVIPVDYFSTTDPALDVNNHVAKGKRWLKTDNTTTPTWLEQYIRNPANDGWILLWTRGNLTAPAEGDILYVNASGRMIALGIGDEDDVLTVDASGVPVWAPGGGSSLPDWLSVHPDAPPGSADADDDEFHDVTGQSGPINGLDAKWTQVNWGTTPLSFANGCAIFTPQDAGTTSLRILSQPVPGGNFIRRAKISLTANSDNFAAIGIVASQGTGATDNHLSIEYLRTDTDGAIQVRQWSDYNTITGFPALWDITQVNGWIWFELEYDGTNIIFRVSVNGVGYATVHTETVAGHLTALGNWGVFGWSSGTDPDGVCVVDYVRAV
jgi:hypothetical protein